MYFIQSPHINLRISNLVINLMKNLKFILKCINMEKFGGKMQDKNILIEKSIQQKYARIWKLIKNQLVIAYQNLKHDNSTVTKESKNYYN